MRTSSRQHGRKLDKIWQMNPIQDRHGLTTEAWDPWNTIWWVVWYRNNEAQAKSNPRNTNSHIQDLVLYIHSADCDPWLVDFMCRSVFSIDLPSIVASGHDASGRDRAEVTGYLSGGVWSLVTPWCVLERVHRTNSTCAYECGGAMLRVSGVAPAPSGHEWRFQCSVGVDCSDAEPRCIWLAVLRGVSPCASPRPTPIASPRRRGSRRVIQRHRLSWVRAEKVVLGWQIQYPISSSLTVIIFWPWVIFIYFIFCQINCLGNIEKNLIILAIIIALFVVALLIYKFVRRGKESKSLWQLWGVQHAASLLLYYDNIHWIKWALVVPDNDKRNCHIWLQLIADWFGSEALMVFTATHFFWSDFLTFLLYFDSTRQTGRQGRERGWHAESAPG